MGNKKRSKEEIILKTDSVRKNLSEWIENPLVEKAGIKLVLLSVVELLKNKSDKGIDIPFIIYSPCYNNLAISDLQISNINFAWADRLRIYIDEQLYGSLSYEETDSNENLTIEAAAGELTKWCNSKDNKSAEDAKCTILAVVSKLSHNSSYFESELKVSSNIIKEFVAKNNRDWNNAHNLARAVDYDISLLTNEQDALSIKTYIREAIINGEKSLELGDYKWLIVDTEEANNKVLVVCDMAIDNGIFFNSASQKIGSDALVAFDTPIKKKLATFKKSSLSSLKDVIVGDLTLLNAKQVRLIDKENRKCVPFESIDEDKQDLVSQIHFKETDSGKKPTCSWWLLPMRKSKYVPLVYMDGGICRFPGVSANRSKVWIRPAMWLTYGN